MLSSAKQLALAVTAVAMSAASASVAHAQIHVVGTTAGCFAATISAGCATSLSNNGATLTYFASSINTDALGGPVAVASLGGDPISAGNPANVNNYGSFRLDLSGVGAGGASFSSAFTLQLDVTSPSMGVGSTTAQVSNFANGTVTLTGGTLFVSFADFMTGNALSLASYKAIPNANVLYFVNDAAIGSPRTGDTVRDVSLTGAIAVVPEPSTYLLLATGMAGLGMVARRRRTVG